MFASVERARDGPCVKQTSIGYGPLSVVDPRIRILECTYDRDFVQRGPTPAPAQIGFMRLLRQRVILLRAHVMKWICFITCTRVPHGTLPRRAWQSHGGGCARPSTCPSRWDERRKQSSTHANPRAPNPALQCARRVRAAPLVRLARRACANGPIHRRRHRRRARGTAGTTYTSSGAVRSNGPSSDVRVHKSTAPSAKSNTDVDLGGEAPGPS